MDFLRQATWLNLKKIGLQPLIWLLMLGLPLAVVTVQQRATNTLPRLSVGIYANFDHPETLGSRVLATLQAQVAENPFLVFVGFNDPKALNQAVQYHPHMSHGYLIREDLTHSLLAEGVIPTLISPNTLALPIVNEIVYAALLYQLLPELTVDIIGNHFEGVQAHEFVAAQIAFYRELDIFMTPDMQQVSTAENPVQELQSLSTLRLTHGIIGITLLAALLFVTPLFLSEKEQQLLLPLPNQRTQWLYSLSTWLAMTVVLMGLGMMGLIFTQFSVQNVFSLFIYVLKSVIIMAGFSMLLKTDNLLHNFGLFVILAHVLFGGVLVDLHELNPTLGRLQQLFPLFHYIQALL